MSNEKILILDLDNTLYCWMDAYAKSLNAVIDSITANAKITKKECKSELKQLFKKYETVEAIQKLPEMKIWEKMNQSKKEINQRQVEAMEKYINEFAKNIQLYPGVYETLKWAKSEGVILIAFSEADAFWVDFRLKKLKIKDFFVKIYAGRSNEPIISENNLLEVIPSEKMKPNTFVIDKVLKEYNVDKRNLYVMGDSKRKDIYMANQADVPSIWAKYGQVCMQSSKKLVGSITPLARGDAVKGQVGKPRYTVVEFQQVKQILSGE